ncbi:MAG: YfhO family protein [Bacteroidota bacterium]
MMKKINFKEDVLAHGLALLVFLLVTLFFFSPIFFDNKTLDQHDIQQHLGSSKTLRDFRDVTGDEGLWVPNMFSGMPAYLVNLDWSDGVVVGLKKMLSLFLPHPICNIFLAFVSYYIMLLAFRIRPYLAIAGALAFGLSSYMIIGLSAGHNARIGAIAFMPIVMAGIHLAFSGKRILGFGVTAAGLALHLRENHLQITYYLVLIVAGYGLVQLIVAAREKKLADFFKTLGILVPAAVIAAGTFFGQFWAITEYTRYSIRGPSELIKPGLASGAEGLSKEYAFAYNYGIWEPMTLIVPNFYGGSSRESFVQDEGSATYKALTQSNDNQLANQLANYSSAYWGPQSFTIGGYYGGAIIFFLFVAGILLAEKKYVLWLVPLSVLSLMLSWGDSFSSFNYFMFDYFPGYNKFRSVNFALVIILFSMPFLSMLGLEEFFQKGVTKGTKQKLIIAFSVAGGMCLMLLLFAGMGNFTREGEGQLPTWFLNALRADRKGLLQSDAFRSLSFIFSIFILLYFDVRKKVSEFGFFAFLIFMIAIDLSVVDKRYFTKENYQRKRDGSFFAITPADEEIRKDKSYYRVYNLNLQNSWSEARTSYYHNSLGGYHGAKLRRYQDLYDSCLYSETNKLIAEVQTGNLDFTNYGVMNMLNAKYLVFGPDRDNIILNEEASGPAWFAKKVIRVNSPMEELRTVAEVNTNDIAVIDGSKFKLLPLKYDSVSVIKLIESKPPYLKYESESSVNSLAVFSEIYYPKGWHALIEGKEVPILRVDYVLRALEVPSGKHVIEFKFEPKPYVIGNKIAMASSWVLILLVIGCLGWSFKNPK